MSAAEREPYETMSKVKLGRILGEKLSLGTAYGLERLDKDLLIALLTGVDAATARAYQAAKRRKQSNRLPPA